MLKSFAMENEGIQDAPNPGSAPIPPTDPTPTPGGFGDICGTPGDTLPGPGHAEGPALPDGAAGIN